MSPYTCFSRIYDRPSNDVSKDGTDLKDDLCSIFNKAVKKCGSLNPLVLDVACGTGDNILKLSKLGYNVVGLDISCEMLAVAKEKLTRTSAKLIHRPMQDIPKDTIYAGVLCSSFSLTYIKSQREILEVFKSVNAILERDGVFAFDMIEPRAVVSYFSASDEIQEWDDISVRPHQIRYDQNTQEFLIQFEFLDKIKNERYLEKHSGRAYRIDEIDQLLKSSGFRSYVSHSHSNTRVHANENSSYQILAYK